LYVPRVKIIIIIIIKCTNVTDRQTDHRTLTSIAIGEIAFGNVAPKVCVSLEYSEDCC